MENDTDLEKIFNDWKLEEEENIRYIQRKKLEQDNLVKNIKTTSKLIKVLSYAKYIRYITLVLYCFTLKYLLFNNKSEDPYIIIIYHYVVFAQMIFARLMSKNIKIKLITNILKFL